MAQETLTSSRRGVIAALALAPIAVAAPSIAIAADAEFDAAVAAYHAAWQAAEDHPSIDMIPSAPGYDEAYQDSIECGRRAMVALRRALSMPARDLRQVITKMDIIWKDSGGESMIEADLFAFVRDDLIRLAA